MAKKTIQLQFRESLAKRIPERIEVLEQARIRLKQEFFGIEGVINEVVEAISSWYLFPEIQEKPVIVNLWGMTGVGKSSLIRRLSELIGFSKKLFWFDLGETSDRDCVIRRTLNELFENENGYPIILCFDEFQHGRTKSPIGEDTAKPDLRIIWNMLSDGTFQMPRYFMKADSLYYLIHELRKAVEQGVQVEQGILVRGEDTFAEIMAHHSDLSESVRKLIDQLKSSLSGERKEIYRKAAVPFLPEDTSEKLFELVSDKFSTRADLKRHLRTLDGQGTILFLQQLLETAISLRTVDCTKAVMFVVGNLDEAYTMCMNLNPDMDPDTFHRGSLRITIPQIKKSLQKLFRPEQIASLGNNHILYPTLNQDAFRKIIARTLDGLSEKVRQQVGMYIEFDRSIFQLIYDEGIYPALGARPLFTTIHILIESKLGKIISEALIQKKQVVRIQIEYKETQFHVRFLGTQNILVRSTTEPVRLILGSLRKPKQDDKQAIVAVHESGHAILFISLLQVIPEMIVSVSADSENSGFTTIHLNKRYRSKVDSIPMLACHIGGFVAEKLVFGEEYITQGSESDIRDATELACKIVKVSGLGSIRGSVNVASTSTNDQLHLNMDDEVKALLEAGERLAEQTLQSEWELFLHMSDYLSDHRMLERQLIEKMIGQYAITNKQYQNRSSFQYEYRKRLKEVVLMNNPARQECCHGWDNISMNKTNSQ